MLTLEKMRKERGRVMGQGLFRGLFNNMSRDKQIIVWEEFRSRYTFNILLHKYLTGLPQAILRPEVSSGWDIDNLLSLDLKDKEKFFFFNMAEAPRNRLKKLDNMFKVHYS